MSYMPNPISTASFVLPPPLAYLMERLAENAHDVWATRRMAEGWRYGPQREDSAKRHPCLVPYRELPESEKEYDRAAVLQTLKAILALGYAITPPEQQ